MVYHIFHGCILHRSQAQIQFCLMYISYLRCRSNWIMCCFWYSNLSDSDSWSTIHMQTSPLSQQFSLANNENIHPNFIIYFLWLSSALTHLFCHLLNIRLDFQGHAWRKTLSAYKAAWSKIRHTHTNNPFWSAPSWYGCPIESHYGRQRLRHPVGHHGHSAEHCPDLKHRNSHFFLLWGLAQMAQQSALPCPSLDLGFSQLPPHLCCRQLGDTNKPVSLCSGGAAANPSE